MLQKILAVSLLLVSHLSTSLDHLSEIPDGKEISIRGFLYQNQEGRWVLAKEPNLKTCCLSSQSNLERQLFLESSFSADKINSIITLKGIFQKEKNSLTRIELIKDDQKNLKNVAIVTILFATLSILVLLWRRKSG